MHIQLQIVSHTWVPSFHANYINISGAARVFVYYSRRPCTWNQLRYPDKHHLWIMLDAPKSHYAETVLRKIRCFFLVLSSSFIQRAFRLVPICKRLCSVVFHVGYSLSSPSLSLWRQIVVADVNILPLFQCRASTHTKLYTKKQSWILSISIHRCTSFRR